MLLEKVGNVKELFYSTDSGRVNSEMLTLDEKGIKEDKYYDKNISRSVLIVSLKSYELALYHGINAPYSSLGENILIDYNPYDLRAGARLLIGDDVVLEISQNCTLCNGLSKVDSKLPKILKDDRGIFAKVINSGFIYKNDTLYLLKNKF